MKIHSEAFELLHADRRTERHDKTVGEFLQLSVPNLLKVVYPPVVQGSSSSSSNNNNNSDNIVIWQ